MNLDDFKPAWDTERIIPYRTGYKNIGVNTSSLNDWRKIENLYHKVSVKIDKVNSLYWGSLSGYLKYSKCKEVWWLAPDNEFVYIYDGKSLGSRRISELINSLIPDVNRKGYKLSDDERKKIILLDSIIHTQRKRAFFLYECLTKAIQNRLNVWFQKKKFHEHDQHCVTFKNNNRTYTTIVMKYNINGITQIYETFE